MTPGQWSQRGEVAAVWPGRHHPLGATWSPEATNFAVHAPAATAVWVCVFGEDGNETRHALTERTLGIWHGAIPGIEVGTRYGFRADGPWEPASGLWFNPDKLLLDPYARAVSGEVAAHPAIFGFVPAADGGATHQRSTEDSAPHVARSVVVHDDFDWGDDAPPRRRWRDTVIYEAHVKGLTARHPQVPEQFRGTYAGLADPAMLAYLRDLGVTAVELLPVHEYVSEPKLAARGLVNYWGYNSIGFFAPHHGYAATGDRGEQVSEFKAMVKALHAAGLEVILDVVYNHTAEAGADGPTLCFRGLDDRGFYRRADPAASADPMLPLGLGDRDGYWDLTGCGNTVDATNPFALRLILDSLRYWVTEMHVDGFRFDLLSALARTGGAVDMRCHLLTAIAQDPVLRHVKLIAEPWDISPDGYRVGGFPPPWVEWNDQFRDELRDFYRGHTAGIRTVCTRLAGSSDLYADDGRSPYASVNFITAHDGFTLRDLVSYQHKHNEANGEENRDGTDHNRSDNHGVEGETTDPMVLAARRRQAANLMATLCLSNGVPMITAGDERGRTQRGNNNAYCQDNEISWVDWSPDDAWLDVHQVTRDALRLRREHPALRQRHWLEGRPTVVGGPKDLIWLHPEGREMSEADWHNNDLRSVGMFVSGDPLRAPGPRGEQQVDRSFLIWLNAAPTPLPLQMPEEDWMGTCEVVLSTDDDLTVGSPVKPGDHLVLAARSVAVLRQA